MAKAKEIIVDGATYYATPPQSIESPIKIVILQRGWVMVGRLERKGSECKLHNAYVIRNWGTSRGLGEIARSGPTPITKLDPCHGVVEFDYLTVVAAISADESNWDRALE